MKIRSRRNVAMVVICAAVFRGISIPQTAAGAELFAQWDAADAENAARVAAFEGSECTAYSDEEFFGSFKNGEWITEGCLDYERYPGLADVREYAKAGDYDAAREELLSFHRELYSGFDSAYTDMDPDLHDYYSAYAIKNNFQINTAMIPTVLDIQAVGKENEYTETDITDRISSIMSKPAPEYSIELFGLKKDGTSLVFESRNAQAAHAPVMELTADGKIYTVEACDDATISPMANCDRKYGLEDTLCAEESVSSIGLARLADSGTKRALIKFDLSGMEECQSIDKAVIKLYGRNTGEGSGELMIIETNNNSWNENEVTFYQGQQGISMEHAVFSNYGMPSFRFDGGVAPAQDNGVNVFAYRYPEELLRFTWAQVLAKLYHSSGDERFALIFLNQWAGYLTQRGDCPRYDKALDGHVRDRIVSEIMQEMINSEYMTPEIWTATMKYYMMELRTQIDDGNDIGNWGTYQITGMRYLLGYAQTLKIYGEGLDTVRQWVPEKINEAFRDDGSGTEIAWGYSFGTFTQLLESEEVLKRTKLTDSTLSASMQEKCEKIIKYFASLLLPGGGNPQVGDEAGYRGINYNDAARNRLLYSVAEIPFWKYLETDGAQGVEPDWKTIRFTGSENDDEYISGIYVMRSGWSDDALYLYTDVDGNSAPGHGHADDNQIVMQAYGQYLLTDQSFSSYASGRVPLDSTIYHNTVCIDGKSQNRSGVTAYETQNSVKKEKRFETNGIYDNTKLTTPQNGDFYGLHTRNILFLKPGFWIVNDYLQPNDKTAVHNYKQNWHMLPAAAPTVNPEGTGRSNFDSGANVIVAQSDGSGAEVSVEPGYFGQGTGSIYDSHYLCYEKNTAGDTVYDTVIYPERPGMAAEVSISALPLEGITECGASASHISITADGERVEADHYIVHDSVQQSKRSFGEYTTDALQAYAERDGDGRVKALILQDATEITDEQRVLFRSSSPVSEFAYRVNGHSIEVAVSDASQLDGITFYADNISNISRISVNGNNVQLKRSGNYIYFGNSQIIDDTRFIIADLTDEDVTARWISSSCIREDYRGRYDKLQKTYCLNWVLGSVGDGFFNTERERLSELDFSDYGMLHIDFQMTRDAQRSALYPYVDNYFSIVLSTADDPGLYDKYKNNECLSYEVDMSKYPINETVSLDIPLSDFITQFDGMKNGVQGVRDGVTGLSDIKSISVFSGPMGKGAVGGEGNIFYDWAFKNSNQDSAKNCGFLLYDIALESLALKAEQELSSIMHDYEYVADDIDLPSELSCGRVEWSSSKPYIIDIDGSVDQTDSQTGVILTAHITGDDGSRCDVCYSVTVAAKQQNGFVIADFSKHEDTSAWIAGSVGTGNGSITETGGMDGASAYSTGWVTGSVGEEYLRNDPARFSSLSFSDYAELCMELLVMPGGEINNYFSIVLSTAKKPSAKGTIWGVSGNYSNDECLIYEVDMNAVPHGIWFELRIPLSDFITQFDGRKNGMQGVRDGITELSDIKSISIVSGAAGAGFINGNAPEFHKFTTWAFKNALQAPDAGVIFIQNITLAPFTLVGATIENGSRNVMPDTQSIKLYFNEMPDAEKLGLINVTVNGRELAHDKFTARVNDTSVTLSFFELLEPDAEYAVTADETFSSADGASLGAKAVVEFRTAVLDNWRGEAQICTDDGDVFSDMTAGTPVYGRMGYICDKPKNISAVTALYKEGRLMAVSAEEYNAHTYGIVSSPAVEYDPAEHDCIKFFVLEKNTMSSIGYKVSMRDENVR